MLVHGVRRSNELAYLDQFVALQAHPPCATDPATLQLVRSVTREAAAQGAGLPGLLKGRITTLLEKRHPRKCCRHALDARSIACDVVWQSGHDYRRPSPAASTRIFLPCRRVIPGQFLTEKLLVTMAIRSQVIL
ncbi:hypothetical protein ACFS07_25315 [Undibacterium arcticum]